MKPFKNLNKILFLLVVLLFYSCNKSKSSKKNIQVNDLKEINNLVLYEGKKDTLNSFFKFMTYYSNKKEPLVEMLIYENNDSIFHYKFTAKNNFKKIIYLIEVKNGEILEEYNLGELKNFNIDLGSFYYKNYCYQCHHTKKESIGKSIQQLSMLDIFQFNKNYNETFHDMDLTKNELDTLYKYITRY